MTSLAASVPGAEPRLEIVLDITRLLRRVFHPTPTGVDRVEMAYARHLPRLLPGKIRFAGTHPITGYGRLDPGAVAAFLAATQARWEAATGETRMTAYRHVARALFSLRAQPVPPRAGPRVVLQASPSGLEQRAVLERRLAREGGRFVCLVHDLIPILHPEFARPGGAATHARRLENLARCAHLLLANSHATAGAVEAMFEAQDGPRPPTIATPLGCDDAMHPIAPVAARHPYFVCVGTIEPRKNHLLLLHLWRRLHTAQPDCQPELVLVGRRGWENENVLDMLDRCRALASSVREFGRLPDAQLRPLLAGARALLMPSFAEGYGLPVAEALAMGVPVIASDLPAHREAGGDAPEYLDPLDGPAWEAAIRDYADPHSRRRAAQVVRIAAHRPRRWEAHFDQVVAAIEGVAAC